MSANPSPDLMTFSVLPLQHLAMQPPTSTNLRIRSVRDAEIVLHAVALNILPMVTRRLDDEERLCLRSGCVYVWEERSSNPLEATGQEIQRFTEGRSWGPSRARDDFLLYYEKESASRSSLLFRNNLAGSSQLIKQTYSVFVHDSSHTPRKWHLNAYYTQDTVDQLRTVDQMPELRTVRVPEGLYVCARMGGTRRGSRASRTTPVDGRVPSPPSTSSVGTPRPPSQSPTAVAPHATSPVPQPGTYLLERRLAPLEYLENISPQVRDPIDDAVIRRFDRL
ncbi:uncharacterized protein FIBRA_01063 [Fibroporia radiculosa]|uniref:cAMP-independent regulatory protein pac2 n=1 Tax=Fibroporia radiculosa TaxID=599839 RepID=J4HSP7_9APHY|nr:uncharacterized protein FIBRA_01063 [Fibroporia radiculosa]CCL99052.1 predicted protein [Fibroporia radiculosa]